MFSKTKNANFFYYRYRPYSEISLKELLYSEMYFTSPEECNDPFDSKTFYSFVADTEKWANFILVASRPNHITPETLQALTEHICSICPITIEDTITKNIFETFEPATNEEKLMVPFIASQIQEIVKAYRPATRYFVSFSKSNDEPVMWSHYADKHKGFCLIFRAIEGHLNQSYTQRKHQIVRKTPKGISPTMSFGMPEKFKFSDISYEHKVTPLNAFLHMPVMISGKPKNEKERLKIIEDQQKHYIQKGKSWEYEKESRILLPPPPSFIFGEHVEFSNHERLFHYEPSQLVGIIYGSMMSENNKNRIREILRERSDWKALSTHNRIEFNFIEFEAIPMTNQRHVEIQPISILSYPEVKLDDPDFGRRYNEWKEGWGHDRGAHGSKRVKVD